MDTDYAQNTDRWEAWQQAYKFGVFLLYPPDGVREPINALRTQFDPLSQSYCDAHISLTIPLPRPLLYTQWLELESIVAAIKPFPIRYGPLKNYLPHPGVCLAIEPQDELDKLRHALESTSVFMGAPPRKYPFSAHMTIAEFISAEQTLALMSRLENVAPGGVFGCTGISYAVPDEDFHFTERARLQLGIDTQNVGR